MLAHRFTFSLNLNDCLRLGVNGPRYISPHRVEKTFGFLPGSFREVKHLVVCRDSFNIYAHPSDTEKRGLFSKLTKLLPASATHFEGSLWSLLKLLMPASTSSAVAWLRNSIVKHPVRRST